MVEASATRGRLLRLASELAHELAVAERIAAGVMADAQRLSDSAGPAAPETERGNLAVVAMGLHRWYGAVESIVERVERTFGTIPAGSEWHAELLAGAVLEIGGVRPPILPAAGLDHLRELLRFRHFFRHAYAVELDRARLLTVAGDLTAVHALVHASIRDFCAFLTTASEAVSRG